MLARLILALLIAAFTTPAMAALPCHMPATTVTTAHGHHAPPAPEPKATPEHLCVGCVPPSMILPAALTGPVLLPAPTLLQRVATGIAGRATAPALPPPRQ